MALPIRLQALRLLDGLAANEEMSATKIVGKIEGSRSMAYATLTHLRAEEYVLARWMTPTDGTRREYVYKITEKGRGELRAAEQPQA